jgi:urea transport system substrate-binding protein
MPVLVGLAALLIVAAVLFRWFWAGTGGQPGGALAGRPSIKVGILHSRSGTMAIDERPVIDATVFAIEEINAAGGLLGRRVEAIIEDGQSDAQTFAERAEKLIAQDKVSTIFGCWTSASRKAVKDVVEYHNHLLLYPVQSEGLEQSPNIVYLGAAPNQQIIPAVKWCASFLEKKRMFLVGSDYIFPRAANAIIRDQVKRLGVQVVGEEYRPLGSSDMTQIIEKIRSSKAEVILNTINGDSNIAFFRALRAAGISSSEIPTISFSTSEDSLSSLRPQDLAGDYAVWNYFQGVDNVQNKSFVNRFQQRFGFDRVISDPMEAAYAGVQMWAKAVQASGSEDAAVIRGALAGQSLDAPEGRILIDPATMGTYKYIRIAQITKEGKFKRSTPPTSRSSSSHTPIRDPGPTGTHS